ncbi:FAD-dependent monooxygenase [Streptomyces orinoci]|uniref:FAD-dependent monooxygenase n=1 Tax=Streptomyces orinoci TaxID=67339 RepID=A0ABV3K737_STRON|nr:FAD-dependent monooxygenase [Streptomyces orinoci]
MNNGKVLISGAGIAGPALAYWLGRLGYRPTVVEIAPALRGGGQAVDFRGETHLTVLERMGLLPELRRIQTGGSPMAFVDERGRRLLELPGEFNGGALEVPRGELSRVLYRHSLPYTDYLFGDTVTGLTETPDGVRVTFRHAEPATFDLVFGADGLHSTVRRLAFGPERDFVTHLGYYVATWELPHHGPATGSVGLNVPGRLAAVGAGPQGPGRSRTLFVFASPERDHHRHDPDQHKRLITEAFTGLGWEVPRLLDSLRRTEELYFDSISRAVAPRWSTGRIALLGDAASGTTLGGMGTGMGIVAAHVLAGELALAGGDHRTAFPRYQQRLARYARICRKGNAGRFLAPRTAHGLRLRNGLLSRPLMMKGMLKAAEQVASAELPAYPFPNADVPSAGTAAKGTSA